MGVTPSGIIAQLASAQTALPVALRPFLDFVSAETGVTWVLGSAQLAEDLAVIVLTSGNSALKSPTLVIPINILDSGNYKIWWETRDAELAKIERRRAFLHDQRTLELLKGLLHSRRRALKASEDELEDAEGKYIAKWGEAPPL